MKPRHHPVLRALGYGPKDRVAVIHVDDMGMSGCELGAFEDISHVGLQVSGSAMVPCSGFAEVAAWYRKHPEADLGLHLTLTSEWSSPRWAPLTAAAAAPGLRDSAGFFHASRAALFERASLESMRLELAAQVGAAKGMGFAATHLDCHMYVGHHPDLQPAYFELAQRQGLIAFAQVTDVLPQLAQRAELGSWLFDHKATMKNGSLPEDRLAQAVANLDAMAPGLSILLIHPVRAEGAGLVTPDWTYRCSDYRAFTDPALIRHVRNSGLQLIDYRSLAKVGAASGTGKGSART